jgi:hypothetical protein
MEFSSQIETGWDGESAVFRRTQSHNSQRMGSTSNKMVTPDSAHPDRSKSPDPNLSVDIDFDPPSRMLMNRPRDTPNSLSRQNY